MPEVALNGVVANTFPLRQSRERHRVAYVYLWRIDHDVIYNLLYDRSFRSAVGLVEALVAARTEAVHTSGDLLGLLVA